ncbi:unnamed protein product [Paramecium primaurelia]|uniref:Uncharacterized protein n=1 Tax=Paramecium primaurelia TaxID=5886 RepID=A0A8S1L6Y8_PARPR|nr:unnamed protein product [Paramecium primaurelia]
MSVLQTSSEPMSMAESIVPYVYEPGPILNIVKNGDELVKSSHYQEAYEVYSQALPLIYQNSRPEVIEPTTEDVLLGLAKCSLTLNKLSESKHYCFEILKSYPQHPQALLYLGLIYKQEGNEKKSEKYIKWAYSCNQDTDINSENQLLLQIYRQYSDQSNNYSSVQNSREQKESTQTSSNDLLTQIVASTILGSLSTTVINWKRRYSYTNIFISAWNSTCIYGCLRLNCFRLKYLCFGVYMLSLLALYLYQKYF